MRKISVESVDSFLKCKNFNKANMSVKVLDCRELPVIELRLYGNTIAKIENNEIYISNAGWKSLTTKERLNALLRKLNAGYIQQIKGIWYLNNTVFPDNEFIPVLNYLNHLMS